MSVIGLKVGPFEIVGPAWVPEPGAWYLARRSGNRPPTSVLVRVLPPDASAADRAAVQRQFEALRGIEDPRVPAPVAYYEGTGALAISAVVGAPLTDAIRGRADAAVAMSPATLLDVVLEIAETLQRVHHRNRHHGHLDPDQVVLAADGSVWLFGFGVPDAAPDPRWIAPERARGEAPGPATDQWSLAAIACALVTGKAPWTGDPTGEAARGDPGPVVDGVERQWPALGRLLRRMLDPHPANRYPSLHPARQELLALARRAGGTSDRRELGAKLVRRRGAPEVDPPTADEMAMKPEIVPAAPPPAPEPAPPPAQTAPPPAPATPSQERPATPAGADARPPARRDRLPSEPIPVVRPDVSEEVPLATRGPLESSMPEIEFVEPRDPSIEELAVPPEIAKVWRDEAPEEEGLVNAPTAVPPETDPGEGVARSGPSLDGVASDPPSVSDDWFQPAAAAAAVPDDPSLGLGDAPVPATFEPALPPEEDDGPASRAEGATDASPAVPIQRIAVALAGLMVLLGLVWLAVRVL